MKRGSETCAALNASGTKCRSLPVAETDYWRCAKHADWYDTATREEREALALIEILETIESLNDPAPREDLETRRSGVRGLWG